MVNDESLNGSMRSPFWRAVLINSIAGGLSGVTAYTVTCPLEVIQTRLQSTIDNKRIANIKPVFFNLPKYFGADGQIVIRNKYLTIVSDIYRTNGLRGFYRGYIPLLIGLFPAKSVSFTVNMRTRSFLNDQLGPERRVEAIAISAYLGSVAAATFTCPIWVAKTHLQLKRHTLIKKVGVVSVIKDIYNNNGIPGFYRGLSSAYYGAFETALYWIIFESLKHTFRNNSRIEDNAVTSFESGKAAFIAKTICLIIGYPTEVARTRMRQALKDERGKLIYREFWTSLYKICKEEGIKRLYLGLAINLVRQVPNATIMMVFFENINHYLAEFVL